MNNKNDTLKYTLVYILAMAVFGTIGIVKSFMSVNSSFLAFTRSVIGAVFLLGFSVITKRRINFTAVKKNLLMLILSSGAIAVNWIFLFEAYNYTSVAVATICYYLCPLMLMVASPIVFGERLTAKKLICTFVALFGMAFVSGLFDSYNEVSAKGILFGVGAAAFYALAVILNKEQSGINAFDRTLAQFIIAPLLLLPYTLLTGGFVGNTLDATGIAGLAVIGIIHTGICYALYFGAIDKIPLQSSAILSYIDPVVAILLSVTVLRQNITTTAVIGAVMIIGASFAGEINFKRIIIHKQFKKELHNGKI